MHTYTPSQCSNSIAKLFKSNTRSDVNNGFLMQKLKLPTLCVSVESFSHKYFNVPFRLSCYKKVSFTFGGG